MREESGGFTLSPASICRDPGLPQTEDQLWWGSRWLRRPLQGLSVGTFRGALTSPLKLQFPEGWLELGPRPRVVGDLGQVRARLCGPVLSCTMTRPTSVFVPDSALLLFLAMPMLTVGGILFLITNLQVGVVGPHPRHLAGGRGGQGKAKHFSISAASNRVGPSQDGSFWLV